jgi:hypothetical protein
VSNVTRLSNVPELNGFHAVEPVQSSTNFFLLKRGGMSYLMVIEEPSANSIIACPTKSLEYKGKHIWIVLTGVGGLAWLESRIPPVPGCLIDPITDHIAYPPEAMGRFGLLHTNLVAELKGLDGRVSIRKGWSDGPSASEKAR